MFFRANRTIFHLSHNRTVTRTDYQWESFNFSLFGSFWNMSNQTGTVSELCFSRISFRIPRVTYLFLSLLHLLIKLYSPPSPPLHPFSLPLLPRHHQSSAPKLWLLCYPLASFPSRNKFTTLRKSPVYLRLLLPTTSHNYEGVSVVTNWTASSHPKVASEEKRSRLCFCNPSLACPLLIAPLVGSLCLFAPPIFICTHACSKCGNYECVSIQTTQV